MIVEQTVIGLTVLWRERGEPWHFQTPEAGEVLALPEIDASIPIDDLYTCVNLD